METTSAQARPWARWAIAGAILLLAGALALINGGRGTAAQATTLEIVHQGVSHSVSPTADFAPATDGAMLRAGQRVRTDSTGRAELHYFDGSITRLGADTTYVLEKLESSGGRQIVGKLDVG